VITNDRPVVLAGVVAVLFAAGGCATTPAARPAQTARSRPAVDLDTKVGWIVRLEQQRILHVDEPAAAPAAPAADPAPAAPTFAPASSPDLRALVLDPDPVVRRRSAMAVGRIGMTEGVPLLLGRLADPEESVREMAAFGLGLLGSRDAVPPLIQLLGDSALTVRGRAIEALGQIGDPSAAGPIAAASTGCGALLAPLAPDDESWPLGPGIEACRLALFALVRLRDADALRSVALDAQGQPISRWWPVAFALQRGGVRDADALLTLASSAGVYTRAFALRALATLEDARLVPIAQAIVGEPGADLKLRVAALRALASFDADVVRTAILPLWQDPDTPPNLLLEAIPNFRGEDAFEILINLFAHPWAALRLAAMRRAAILDAESFLVLLSSLGPDPDWSVRAGLASILGGLSLPFARVEGWLTSYAADPDVRVKVAALQALAAADAPDLNDRLTAALSAPDYSLRAAAARLMGRAKPEGGVPKLVAAYQRGDSDATEDARVAALNALAQYGGPEAIGGIEPALADREWPVRLLAARLLHGLGQPDAQPVRPAPVRQAPEFFESAALLHPPFSPHAFIETRHGTIEIELNIVEAAVTSQAFIELARAGFYNGLRVHRLIPHFVVQAGDPRGDGSGGPGFTQRDELSPVPFVRGTVGMAISGPDTAGSQFFIALSPQPHLDGDYTVFGKVVAGDDVLDRVQMWDVIERVRIWDGVSFR
jgi:cyclophilin family peptidyl-prolyl cis-trans isomerase